VRSRKIHRAMRPVAHRPHSIREVTRQRLFLGVTAAVTGVAGVLHYATGADVATFVVAGIALAGLAWVVGVGTESVGGRLGPAATGVLQSTLGNLPELFIVLFALHAGEIVVAQTSVLGSLFANGLLVLGLVIVSGARAANDGIMRFGPRLPNDTAVLLLLASFLIVILGVSDRIGDRASAHQVEISAVGAIVLLFIYGTWLADYLRRGGTGDEPALEQSAHHIPIVQAIVLLGLAGVAAAFVSDWFIAALDPAVRAIGVSKGFTGLVIVGIAGNAVENVVGITLAAKGHSDLAISVVKNSVAQIAVFLFPALVLLSLFFNTRLTFVVNPVLAGAVALMAIAVWTITGDGRAPAFEGWALAGLYVILATVVWFE
jgi:Ca2+:H+ antiporter